MRISDWSSDVCSSDLAHPCERRPPARGRRLGDAAPDDRRGALDAPARQLPAARPRGLARRGDRADPDFGRSEEHTSELQSLMRISYAVFCLKKTTQHVISAAS